MKDNTSPLWRSRSIRITEYDYTQAGAYFVTVCTYRRDCLLGAISDSSVVLSPYGEIAKKCWEDIQSHFKHIELDMFATMPNHLHGILVFRPLHELHGEEAQHAVPLRAEAFGKPVPGSLPTIIRSFKAASTKRINESRGKTSRSVWQRNYYEHAIRSQSELDQIREYVSTNPIRWALDRDKP